MAVQKKVKLKVKSSGSAPSKVSDLVITDEFKTINIEASGKDAAGQLMSIPRGVVLVINDKNKAQGVITAREFLTQIVNGENPVDMAVNKLMNADILEIQHQESLDKVVPEITTRDPYAVIVVDKSGAFKGYFSPKDYQEALAKVTLQK